MDGGRRRLTPKELAHETFQVIRKLGGLNSLYQYKGEVYEVAAIAFHTGQEHRGPVVVYQSKDHILFTREVDVFLDKFEQLYASGVGC